MAKQTNEQKYKTAEERVKAFGEFCKNEFCNQCNHLDCKLHKQGSAILHCYDGWLALEAEEEKPENCPFCGKNFVSVINHKAHPNKCAVECYNREDDCCYRGPFKSTEAEAIAAHNRVARAVRAAKENNK